jgi:hypothetical protein
MGERNSLPKNWVWVTLSEIANAQSGSGFPKSFQGLRIGDYPIAKVSDITIPSPISLAE